MSKLLTTEPIANFVPMDELTESLGIGVYLVEEKKKMVMILILS